MEFGFLNSFRERNSPHLVILSAYHVGKSSLFLKFIYFSCSFSLLPNYTLLFANVFIAVFFQDLLLGMVASAS